MNEEIFLVKQIDMINDQLKRRGIKDPRVLDAFMKVKRHQFVLPGYSNYAYGDYPLDIGYNQTISQPYIIALMVESLDIKDTDTVLEIGTGSGYQTAILSCLASETYKDSLKCYPRILFDDSLITLKQLRENRKPLPDELHIVPITKEHLEKGMIKEEIIDKFFQKKDFLRYGFGFALVNQKGTIHGFALTNHPIQSKDEVEVSYRVGYDSYQTYRKRGIGTTLASMFIEESLKRGFHPIWDAANEVSAHIAKKLGYVEKTHWFMYHLPK